MNAEQFFADVAAELTRAQTTFPPMNSLHEAKAVIEEEFDEFWDEVKVNQSRRNPDAIYRELVQLAAMVARAAVDCGAQEYRK